MLLPAMVSGVVAPALMTWRDPLASFVFPDLDGFPDLNGAISCFLAPAVSVQSARFLCSLRS